MGDVQSWITFASGYSAGVVSSGLGDRGWSFAAGAFGGLVVHFLDFYLDYKRRHEILKKYQRWHFPAVVAAYMFVAGIVAAMFEPSRALVAFQLGIGWPLLIQAIIRQLGSAEKWIKSDVEAGDQSG